MAKAFAVVALMAATASNAILAPATEARQRVPGPAISTIPSTKLPNRAITDPVTRFTLPNGLKVIVQTSRRVPLISATVVYDVGSKDEGAGQHGYAHLFEHLALDGSAHWNEGALRSLQDMGATNINAITTQDTTTFFETFPRAALDRVLFLEADRMGHIGAALTPERIKREVGVVLNEKRLRASEPFGGLDATILGDMYPADHPYHHSVIGDEADLDAVTVEGARGWFDTYYGPSNVTLILAGDIGGDEARALVAKYFGGLAPRLPVDRLLTRSMSLPGAMRRQMFASVPDGRLYVSYFAPPAGSPAIAALDLIAQIMANGARSRLNRRLIEELGLAQAAFVTFDEGLLSSRMGFTVAGIKGDQMARVEAEVDAALARFVAEGPTQAESESARAARIQYLLGLQGSTSGKAFLLARGARQNQEDDYAEAYLQQLLSATPESVRRVAADVYGRPGYQLAILPKPPLKAIPGGYDLTQGAPPIGPMAPITFPAVQQAQLSNGLNVILVSRPGGLSDTLLLRFDDGGSAGASHEIAPIVLDLLAAKGKTSGQLAAKEQVDALNGWLNDKIGLDHADLIFNWDAAQLSSGLALFGRMLTRPDVAPDALASLKSARIDRLRTETINRGAGAERALYTAIYGTGHPYAPPATAADAIAQVEAIDPTAVRAWLRTHLRPDRATLYIAADADMVTLKPLLEKALNSWKAEGPAVPPMPIPPARGRAAPSLTVIDKPGAAQTYIMAGKVIPAADMPGGTDAAATWVGNEVYGGNSTSRIGANLRGDKGWTYGIGSGVYDTRGQRRWIIAGTVDRAHSGDSVAELGKEMRMLTSDRPPDQVELGRIVTTAANSAAAQLESNADLLSAMADAQSDGLPYDDIAHRPMRLRALTLDQVKQAARAFDDPATVHWVLVGDWAQIRNQFKDLKLGVPEVIEPAR